MMLPADVMIGFSSFSCYPFCLTLSRLICVVSLLYCCWAGYVHRSSWSWSEKGARSYDFCGIHPICVGILSTYDVSFAYSWISKYRSIWFFRHNFFSATTRNVCLFIRWVSLWLRCANVGGYGKLNEEEKWNNSDTDFFSTLSSIIYHMVLVASFFINIPLHAQRNYNFLIPSGIYILWFE